MQHSDPPAGPDLSKDASDPFRWGFIDALGDGIYVVDPQGRCTFINKAALTLLRFDAAQEVLGHNMHNLIHHTRPNGTHYPVSECPLLGTLSSGHPVRLENELLWRRDGTSFLAEYSSFPVVTDGTVTGSVITFTDAATRDDAQARLALQHAVAQVLAAAPELHAAPVQILAAIGSGLALDAGAFWLADAGKAAGRFRCAATWHTSTAPEALRQANQVSRGNGASATEGAIVGRDRATSLAVAAVSDGLPTSFGFPVLAGSERVGAIEFCGSRPLDVERGMRDALTTLGHQIGQFIKRRRLEEDLRDNERLKGAILEAALDCIITVDQDSRVLEFNPAAERTFGYDRDAVLGEDLAGLIIPPEYRAMHRGGMAHYLATGEGPVLGRRIEVEALRASGERFPAELAITPTRVGQEVRFTAYMRDITARKRAEHDLAAARDAAEAANRAKSTFMANMSHELRTPLAAIIGYSEMIQEMIADGVEATALAGEVAKVESNARHLLGLINDVLDLARIESGKMEVYAETFEVAAALREVASIAGSLMVAKGNRLRLDLPPGLGRMHSDLTKVRQCLLNLLSNAAKFTQDGTISLSATRIAQAGPQEWLALRVQDTGIGMSAEHLDKLFLRFSQADSSTTRRFGGSGLGLSITKAFCTMLGGDIAVESAPGVGSTFTIMLPAVLPDRTTDDGSAAEAV